MEWFKAADILPTGVLGRYIVCLKNKMVLEMNYSSILERWWRDDIGDEPKTNKVVYWMELPKPPKR